ncbi:hypothetical protein E4K10_46655 [Streptomyces sp. T1317-0309]|nr:hypothetical protein E4K10_46655 [Streptomyces sp. T1317-0309]
MTHLALCLCMPSPETIGATASPDLPHAMVKRFADAPCKAEYGQVSDGRVNHRNGYLPRNRGTRAGTVELATSKLQQVSYPRPPLERYCRSEQARISVIATANLLGDFTSRVKKLAKSLGVTQLSKSPISAMARHLGE